MSEPSAINGRTLRVGCPMWAHPPWVGRFLSPGRRGEELAEYATWCNTVEGNTTYYGIPSARTVAKWAEQAPADFRFAFKVPRTVTHERRMHRDGHRDVAAFLRALRPLGERVGPIQFQLPPSFGAEGLSALLDFVSALPSGPSWMVELRHRTFFDGGPAQRRLDEALAALDIGRVVLDTRPLYAVEPDSEAAHEERRNKPRLPIATKQVGTTPIVRIIGSDDPAATLDGRARLDRAGARLARRGSPALSDGASARQP